jgi:hypothetical protein
MVLCKVTCFRSSGDDASQLGLSSKGRGAAEAAAVAAAEMLLSRAFTQLGQFFTLIIHKELKAWLIATTRARAVVANVRLCLADPGDSLTCSDVSSIMLHFPSLKTCT